MRDTPNAEEIIQRKIRNYAAQGEPLDRQAAIDELAADYAGQMVDNTSVLERFIDRYREDRTLLRRLADAFRSLIDRVGGRYRVNARNAVNLLEKALRDSANAVEKAERQEAREQERAQKQAKRERAKENTATRGGDGQYAIKETADGKKYVRADRQVIFGNDPEKWGEQLEDYINGKIRRGQDVVLIGADGDELRLTATSAGKLSDNHTGDGRTMSDAAYERKANAASHIDELAQVSFRGKKDVNDYDSRHGDMASGGWNYRTAHFMDFDGKYYEVMISVAKGADGKMIYNIGQMQERSIPQINGSSSQKRGAQREDASNRRVRGSGKNVNSKFSLKEDSDGRSLTKAQQAYFKDSKAVDSKGRLRVVYHGTGADFNVFDANRINQNWGVRGGNLGFYFSPYISNENPTDSPDIRYSMSATDEAQPRKQPAEKKTAAKPRTAYAVAKEVAADYASDFDRHTVAKGVRERPDAAETRAENARIKARSEHVTARQKPNRACQADKKRAVLRVEFWDSKTLMSAKSRDTADMQRCKIAMACSGIIEMAYHDCANACTPVRVQAFPVTMPLAEECAPVL